MVLVPLGVSLDNWTRGIDSKPKNNSSNKTFTNDSGTDTFRRIESTSHSRSDQLDKKKKKKKKNTTTSNGLGNLVKPKMVSPVQQILSQTKEKDKRYTTPETNDISLNIAATSSALSGRKTKRKQPSSSSSSSSKSRGRSTIKRLQRKRNSQSKGKLGTSKKSSIRKKDKKKKKKKKPLN